MRRLLTSAASLLLLVACSHASAEPSLVSAPSSGGDATDASAEVRSFDLSAAASANGAAPAELFVAQHVGKVSLSHGGSSFVSGVAKSSVRELDPIVEKSEHRVVLRQGDGRSVRHEQGRIVADWAVQVGEAPAAIRVDAGAVELTGELGGASVAALEARTGAGEVRLAWSTANAIDATSLVASSGAGRITVSGLALGKFSTAKVESGAGAVVVSLDGALSRPLSLELHSGAGAITLVVAKGTNVRVHARTSVGAVHAEGFARSGDDFVLGDPSAATRLDVDASSGVGAIHLEAR